MTTKGNRNALRHGLYAREAVLPWESAEAFAALHQSFIDELQPHGPLEHEAVREVAELHWRKQRLAMGYLLPFYREMPSVELIAAAQKGLVALANYLGDAARQPSGTILASSNEVLDLIKHRIAVGFFGDTQPNTSRLEHTPSELPQSLVEQAYDPAALELRLKIETQIDNRIAKTMARLVGLKAYKAMYVVDAPATAPKTTVTALPPPKETVELGVPAPKRKWGDPE